MTSVTSLHALAASALLVLTLAPASPGQSGPEAASANVEAAVLARLAEIETAAQARDVDQVFRFVLDNNKGSLIQNGRFFLTRDEALQSTRQGFVNLASVDYHFNQQHVSVLSPTIALVTGEGKSTATTDDGRVFTTPFAQSVVLVLTNGEWMVIHAHRSFPRSP